MRKNLSSYISVILVATMFLPFQSCNKFNEPNNQPPTCTITSPAEGQEINAGATVTISVKAKDNDGNISEVRFFIDGVGMGSAASFPYNYSWNTSNETISNHTIKATAIDDNGESASDEITVAIIQGGNTPVANFTASPTSGTAPLTVNFTDQSSNNPTGWQWDFGDGQTSTQQNPSYTYNSAGSYTVTLTTTNSSGSDTKTKNSYITVNSGGGSTGTFTDPRNGQTYKTVVIGNQTWMAENMNYKTDNSWTYNNDPANGKIYGRLYTWDAAKTACPSGWHLPSDDEWKTLEMYLGMNQSEVDDYGWRGTDQGVQMKSTSGWVNNGNGTNSSGFNALPGGGCDGNGSDGLSNYSLFWSSSESSGTSAWGRYLTYASNQVYRYGDYGKTNGFSVRCLKGGSTDLVANFTASPTSGTAPLTVNFTDQSSNNPTGWQWDFGDGQTSTQQNPSHTYNSAGIYTVTLTVTNSSGSDTKTKNNYIAVNSGGGGPEPDGYFTDARDGKEYAFKIIGIQTWMAENLNYETGNSWCYDNDPANCDVYGRLYDWNTIMDGAASSNNVPSGVQGICPDGWHIPSGAEWDILVNYLGGYEVAGGKMKEAGTAHWFYPNTGATNSSGFTALPGGYRENDGSFHHLGYRSYWWSSTEGSGTYAYGWALGSSNGQVGRDGVNKTLGFSVRCLKN